MNLWPFFVGIFFVTGWQALVKYQALLYRVIKAPRGFGDPSSRWWALLYFVLALGVVVFFTVESIKFINADSGELAVWAISGLLIWAIPRAVKAQKADPTV